LYFYHFFFLVKIFNITLALNRSMAESEQQAKKPRVGDDHGLPNRYLNDLEDDFFYHIGYSRKDCKETFGDVKVSDIFCQFGHKWTAY